MHKLLTTILIIVLAAGSASAEATDVTKSNVLALGSDELYTRSLAALTILFVVAVLLENAFATIFNWRVFLTYFSRRGMRTLVMIVISFFVVKLFDLDVLANLVAVYKTNGAADTLAYSNAVNETSGFVSKLVTALILAGGSAGVHQIMSALGYRNEKSEETTDPKPKETEAWFSVRVKRVKAVGDIMVKAVQLPKPETIGGPATPSAAILGTISPRRPSLTELLFRNVSRFPPNGGYAVIPNQPYTIFVEGKDQEGNPLKALGEEVIVFAPRAIVDFNVRL